MTKTFSKRSDSTRFSIDVRSVDSSKIDGRSTASRQGSLSTNEGAPKRKSSVSFYLDSDADEDGDGNQSNDMDSSNKGNDNSGAE